MSCVCLCASHARPQASHPKLDKVEEIVVEHFSTRHRLSYLPSDLSAPTEKFPDSRAMIFSSYRDSVGCVIRSPSSNSALLAIFSEISAILERHEPIVKPMTFIGQSSQRTKGLSQKEQTRIVREFREGRHNCLVSTCIGEEGLGTHTHAQ